MPVNSSSQFDVEMFLQPLAPLLADRSVTEIMVNGPHKVFVERRGHITPAGVQFRDEYELEAAANTISQWVNKKLTPEKPRMDARLPDGSRVHIVAPPVAQNGICISIRRFPEKPLDGADLLRFGAVTVTLLEFLKIAVEMHLNIIVSGGTGSGKTSLLNVVGRFVPNHERILVIEDTSELNVEQDHVVRLEARPPDDHGEGAVTIGDLFHSALRMRPDRVIIGEIRGGEALDLVQAMTSGHSGSLATIHASRPSDALARLETLCLYAGRGLPHLAIRTQIVSAVHLVVQAERLRDGSRKVTEIAEVLPLDANHNYQVLPLMAYEVDRVEDDGKIIGSFKAQGNLPTFFERAKRQGYPLQKEWFERKD